MKIQVPQKVTLTIRAKGHNSPVDWGRELFKYSKGSKSLELQNSNFFGFGFEVFGWWCHDWGIFRVLWWGHCPSPWVHFVAQKLIGN